MPISIRRIKPDDLMSMQHTNLNCLAENYQLWYWSYHYLVYPATSHVAIGSTGKLLGYVLGKMNDEARRKNPPDPLHAHITSVAVISGFRKMGLASKLLNNTHISAKSCYRAEYVNLHVRETNRAGHFLYIKTMGYKKFAEEEKYYADGENAWSLRYSYTKT